MHVQQLCAGVVQLTNFNSIVRNTGAVQSSLAAAGSRSSPLALAAAQHPRAQVTCCIDERSLAFWALGYGRATGCGPNPGLKPACLLYDTVRP